jgi:hypothetical protein
MRKLLASFPEWDHACMLESIAMSKKAFSSGIRQSLAAKQ